MFSCIETVALLTPKRSTIKSDDDRRPARGLGFQGQGTVEMAVMIPILFLLFLMLFQPVILLYNKMIMENAASEACRLLSTRTELSNYSDDRYQGYVSRRLAAIPPLDIFHASTSGKAWEITLDGDESSSTVTVIIVNHAKPLPIIGWGASMLGLLEDGYLVQTVSVSMPTQPEWAFGSGVGSPSDWTRQWED